ncbi:hypothetical protein EJB05_51205, partial [Eragrostis curvula]
MEIRLQESSLVTLDVEETIDIPLFRYCITGLDVLPVMRTGSILFDVIGVVTSVWPPQHPSEGIFGITKKIEIADAREEPKEVIFFGPKVADLERESVHIRRDGHPVIMLIVGLDVKIYQGSEEYRFIFATTKRRGKKKNKRFTQWRRRGGWRDWIRKEQAMDGRFDPYEEAEKHAAALAAGLVDPDADEIEELKEQVLAQLRAGQYVVRRGGRYVCPFCNLAIREWSFKCALQHARDIGKSPAAEWEKKAKHRALTVFLSQDAQFAVDRANDGMGGV